MNFIYKAQEQIMAGTAVASTGTAFVASANEWLQFVALCVAIISGALAIYSHFHKRKK